jgi:hypothetical protein
VTSAGTWTFSAAGNFYGNLILLNGQPAASGSAVELEVANGGHLYADNSQGQWWVWNGSGWNVSAAPQALSPDGSILTVGQSGNLETNAGAWAFDNTANAYGNLILLNGHSAAGGSAATLEVARGGNLFADNAQGQWWEWNGSGWTSSTNPTLGAVYGANSSNALVPSSDNSLASAGADPSGWATSITKSGAPPSDLIWPKVSLNQPALASDHDFTFEDLSDPNRGANHAIEPVPTILDMTSKEQSFGPTEISDLAAMSFSPHNSTSFDAADKTIGHQSFG